LSNAPGANAQVTWLQGETVSDTSAPAACPVVAIYAKLDPSRVGAPRKLDRALTDLGVEHDIKTYPAATHGIFPGDPILRVTGLGYNEDANRDAGHRIFAFFDKHLTDAASGGSG
jgi:carboxymethylenebutenolidase